MQCFSNLGLILDKLTMIMTVLEFSKSVTDVWLPSHQLGEFIIAFCLSRPGFNLDLNSLPTHCPTLIQKGCHGLSHLILVVTQCTNVLFSSHLSDPSSSIYEDIRDATHTPKQEGQHLSLTFCTVLGGDVHKWHICNKCIADGLYA